MGLDLVELVLALEDEFGVHIDDEDATRLETPGAVTDYLCSRLRTKEADPCPSQVGFYRLRNAVGAVFQIDRKLIRPSTPLSPLMARNTNAKWRALQKAVGGNNFPRLKRSRLLFVSLVLIVPAIVAIPVLARPFPPTWGVAAFAVASIAANWATYRMGTEIPRQMSTVGQLVPYVTCTNSAVWARSDVLKRVIEITSEQLGIPVEKIHEQSHFVKDLGAD